MLSLQRPESHLGPGPENLSNTFNYICSVNVGNSIGKSVSLPSLKLVSSNSVNVAHDCWEGKEVHPKIWEIHSWVPPVFPLVDLR